MWLFVVDWGFFKLVWRRNEVKKKSDDRQSGDRQYRTLIKNKKKNSRT
jgi:hypothetical protein